MFNELKVSPPVLYAVLFSASASCVALVFISTGVIGFSIYLLAVVLISLTHSTLSISWKRFEEKQTYIDSTCIIMHP